MADYIFNPPAAPRRKYTIKPTWDGHYTGINANGDSATFSLKCNGYLRRPETPGYAKMHYEYECDGEQTIVADEGWENNKPTQGSQGGVCGYCGNSYLIVFGGYWREDNTITECYNYDNVSKSGNFKQTNISYDSSGEIINRTVDTYDFDIVDFNNTSLKGRWWLPIYNAYPVGNDDEITDLTVEANFPIFDTYQHVYSYLASGGANITGVLNAGEHEYGEETKEYYIYNTYSNASVEMGTPTFSGTEYKRYEKLQMNSIPALYKGSGDFEYHLAYNDNDVVGACFSSSSIFDVEINPEWTDGTVPYTQPFYKTLSGKKVANGNYTLGRSWSTNIPIFGSMQDAVDFLNGIKDISDAENWSDINSDSNYSDKIKNKTGVEETSTEFGEVYVRNIFSQLYLCDTSSLYDISNALFDYTPDASVHGQWEKIKKGLEMYGSNPMDAVQGLRFYPFDLSTIFSSVSQQNYIYFGAYKCDITNNVLKVVYANGYKDLGTILIKRTFNDWRDFEPYTRLYIYLPYVGKFQLDLAKYYDKSVNVRYYIDIRTGGCCACLIADNILLDWFDGIIGTEMPITLTDYSSYAQTQLSIIARNAGIGGLATALTGHAVNKELQTHLGQKEIANETGDAFASLASTSSGAAGTAATVGKGVGFAAAVGTVVAGAVMKSRFDMTNNGVGKYNSTRGSSSAMLNQFLPQYPTFMFEIQEIDESPYLNELYGRPTNASGRLGDFSGYLEAEDVMLICPIATDNERQEIIDLVRSGIYI